MKRFMMMLAPLALLAGCGSDGPGAVASSPAVIADRTAIDEKAAITAETAYTAASTLGLRLAQAGLIDRAKFKVADSRAFAALGVVRRTYDAGNADSFGAAIVDLNSAVADIRDLAK